VWDVATRKLTATIVDGADKVAFSPDGQTIAVGDIKGHVYLWHVREPTS
jgi:hypothetical protein